MTTEKKDFTTQGKVVRLLVGQNGPYGVELDNRIVLRKSQFGTIVDLTDIKEGDYVEATYYESRDKTYAKAVRVIAAPVVDEGLRDDNVFVPEADETAGEGDPGKANGGPEVEVSVPASSSASPATGGSQSGGQKKSWAEQQAEKDQYWANKTSLDADRLALDREKFEFEKKRADNIAKQAAIKGATDIVLAVYNMDPGSGVGVAELIAKIYKTAYYLNRPLDVDFSQALKELNKKLEPAGPAAEQFKGIRQAAGGAPGM